MELVAFLTARLDEDEQAARVAGGGQIEAVEYLWETKYLNVRQADGTVTQTTEFSADLAGHIARHDPARVLAEVDAKRRIIAEHEPSWSSGEPEYDHHHEKAVNESGRTRYIEVRDNDPVPPYWCSCCQSSAPCLTLRLLALPFDDHPDYQPEWAPEV